MALSLSTSSAATPGADEVPGTYLRSFAAVFLVARDEPGDDWLAACARVSAAVERTSAYSALLDLGVCTPAEARGVMRALLHRLIALGLTARAGIGPSLALAQLAALRASAREPAVLLTPISAPAFLRTVPVGLLVHLHPRGIVTPETVERLQRYGLHTLGHVARMDDATLRRHFGAVGTVLAAVAHGRDVHSLHPTALPAQVHFRLRLACPISPEHALLLLARLVTHATAHLHARGQQTRELGLCVRWEAGGVSIARRTLRAYTNDPARLAQEARSLLSTLLGDARSDPNCGTCDAHDAHSSHGTHGTHGDLAALRLTLGDFAPLLPAQATFWRTRAQRIAAARTAAETLARRHGRPLLLSSRLAVPDAIFAHERYCLVPLGDVNPTDDPALAHQSHQSHRSSTASPPAPPADTWQDVPLHRHWW
jgi:hypothetical protein